MPAHSGPNTLGESNLVFAYDTGDVKNSYIGEPTVNIYSTDGFSFWQSNGNHTATRYTGNAPELTTITNNYDYHTIVTTGNWSSEVDRALVWTNSGSLQLNTQYAVSFYARVTSTSAANIGAAFYGNTLPNTLALTNQWQRFTVLTSTTATYRPFEFGSKSGAITFQVAGIQYEAKTHSTPYVNGTRSATQGLLPVIGTSSIDLTNVSFDSNAKMVFDGTNDYIQIPFTAFGINIPWTVSCTFKAGTQTTDNGIIALGYLPVVTVTTAGNLYMFWYNGSGYPSITTSGTNYADNQPHNVTATYDGTTVKLYVDSILKGSNVNNVHAIYSNITLGMEFNNGNKCLNGTIYNGSVYNRALTAQEVRQNYQQYKTRFNLS